MKFMKYLLATALAFAFCATASVSHAQGTAVYTASGSSAIWIEIGQAATALPDTGCYWTQTKSAAITAFDDRAGVATGEQGNIWIAWGPGTGTCAAPVAPFNVYSQMNLDSVLGDRCFFMTSSGGAGCEQLVTVAAGTAGNQNTACPGFSLLGCTFTDTAIPNQVLLTFQQPVAVRMNAAATDVRPEDAKFASIRMFGACGAALHRNPYQATSFTAIGLGYGTGVAGIGNAVISETNAGSTFHVYDFNIAGTDPVTGITIPAAQTGYVVNTVGEQPIMVSVGPISATGISQATDIPFSTLNEYFTGIYGRATDLQGPTAANPVVAFIREPLSGTYNTFEFAGPNSNEFKTTQDVNNCNGAVVKQNPLNSPSANGKVAGAARKRAIGTGQVVAALINPAFCAAGVADCIGYWFWSSGNAANFTAANQKYLTVDGVDPILSSYGNGCAGMAPGQIPTTPAQLACVTFTALQAGDYRIWSAVRIVTTPAVAPIAQNLITAAGTLPITANDFVHVSLIKTWKSHFEYPGQPLIPLGQNNGMTISAPGDLCNLAAAAPESGGDAGGMPIYKVGNNDFCTDYNVPIGINDKNF
jgi:hypothetical protein